MEIFFIRRRKAAVYGLVVLLIAVSIAFTQGMAPKVFQAFISQNRQIPIYSVDIPEKKIAISFDAAWGDEFTQEILDILEDHGIKTTFFLVGFWIDKYPDQVKRIHDAGHEIGNHSSTCLLYTSRCV